MDNHGRRIRILLCVVAAAVLWIAAGERSRLFAQQEENSEVTGSDEKKAAVITCHDMIDDGLYQSIKRRSDEAIAAGADYLILDVQTYGGWVKSADDIGKHLILDLSDKVHTVAYISTEAISAGSMISVSCQDIIMKEDTTIGCSVPITGNGDEMGQAEREKSESFVRATFSRAAEANGYPKALLKAMVSRDLEVWQVKNQKTGQMEYFEKEYLPTDPNTYAIDQKTRVVKEGELLTLTAREAKEYGVARAVVKDLDAALAFLAKRDGVTISPEVMRLDTMWSEEMVRWLRSPTVMGLLVMGILLGIYVEFNTPGLGLPALLAATCLVILVSSRFLIGMANWIEIAVLCVGFILIMMEIFVIPGFGVAGFAGLVCIAAGLMGMLVKNPPGEIPWPKGPAAWGLFTDGLFGMAVGFLAFVIIAVFLAKYMDRIPVLRTFVLKASLQKTQLAASRTCEPQIPPALLEAGQTGRVVSALRPAGKAEFDGCVVDVVADGAFIEKDETVRVVQVEGNRIVVSEVRKT